MTERREDVSSKQRFEGGDQLKEVELVSTGVYLPGEPVPYNKIEEVIGTFDQAPDNVKRLVNRLRPMAKELIGIDQCYFALDPKTKKFTENNTSMSVKAIKSALSKAKMETKEIDCLLYGNLLPDYQTPPTSTLIQQELGIERCSEIEIHSNCTGITKLFEMAMDSIRVGRYKTVVLAYSQLSSAYLLSKHYNQDKIKLENILLRWFLSDSASAVILRASDKVRSGIKVEHVFNESLGGKREPGMWLKLGTRNFNLPDVFEQGLHHFGQDYRTVNEIGPGFFEIGFERVFRETGIRYEEVDHILATLPSIKFLDKAKKDAFDKFSIPPEKWFSNVRKNGYSGASSVVVTLDEMIDKNIFRKNNTLVCVSIESSKWMIGAFVLRYL
jgi:3-oxoacyl-[acyl-carrier-protein] synthase III